MSGKYNSNTSTMSSQQANTLDGLVFDYYRYAVDAILKDRKSKMNPIISSTQLVTQTQPASLAVQPVDHIGYINNTLQGWRKTLTKPMTLDIYLYHSQLQQHILVERWSFSYHANTDFSNKKDSSGGGSSSRVFGVVNRRIQTLVRSLYCFVRLLPGFNLLQLSRVEPFMHFQIYESRMSPSNFFYEVSKQSFPVIATTKGKLNTVVQFINSIHVMEIIKTINGGALIGAGPALSVANESAKATSMPIPISGKKELIGQAHSDGSRGRSDDPYRRSFRAGDSPVEGGHVRSYESNLPEGLTRMKSNPIEINPGQSKHRASFDGEISFSNPYSYGSTPPIASYSPNHAPFAAYPINDESSSDGNSTDFAGPSPPYSQYSSSLNSTSPNNIHMALMERRPSVRKSQAGSLGRTTVINISDYDSIRTKITLPASPFNIFQSTNSSGSNNSNNSLAVVDQGASSNNSNKLDFVVQFEKEKERRMSDIYVDITDRSRSISEITRDEELEKLRVSDLSIGVDEDMPFALPPGNPHDLGSSIFGLASRYGRVSHAPVGISESNTYYSLVAVSGELMSKLNEFKEFRSNISRQE